MNAIFMSHRTREEPTTTKITPVYGPLVPKEVRRCLIPMGSISMN
jgi:hypothetical protein